MHLDENPHLGSATSSVMDSPILARVERATQRQEGTSIFYCQTNALPGHVIQRGLLWQQRDKLFARWKERYFILTRDYLHCFRKSTDNGLDRISHMGPFIFKIKLVDVERVTWINKKTYSSVALDFGRDNRILLRSQQGLEDWFDSLEECMIASKERRRALKNNRDSYQAENEQNINSMNSNVENWLAARKKIADIYAKDTVTGGKSTLEKTIPPIENQSRLHLTSSQVPLDRKNAQLQRDYTSDSVPNITKLDSVSLRNSLTSKLRSEDDRWCADSFNEARQRLSLLTDIDINALDSSPPFEIRATPTPYRLNSDVFFLPGLSRPRLRSSIAGPEVQKNITNHQDCSRARTGTNASEYRSKNLLGSFRIPNMLQTTRGTANRYSLVEDTDSLKVIYSTYENNRT